MARDIVITRAEEAECLGRALITHYHLHLTDARILYLFTTQPRKKCDRVRLASAHQMSALGRYLSSLHFQQTPDASIDYGADFLILIDREEWKILREPQRLALIDHELCHCGQTKLVTDTGIKQRWMIKGHDFEAFLAEIQRHGFWKSDVQAMGAVMRQLQLPFSEEIADGMDWPQSPDAQPVVSE